MLIIDVDKQSFAFHPKHGIASSKKAALAYNTCEDYGGTGLTRRPPTGPRMVTSVADAAAALALAEQTMQTTKRGAKAKVEAEKLAYEERMRPALEAARREAEAKARVEAKAKADAEWRRQVAEKTRQGQERIENNRRETREHNAKKIAAKKMLAASASM